MSAASKYDSASALALAGFHVFPLSENSKIPPKGLPWKQEATRDQGRIKAWFEGANYNIGVSCERFGDNGEALAVIDIDVRPDKDGWKTAEALDAEVNFPPTYQVDTPSGGRHLYFVVPRPLRGGVEKLGPGVDLKSYGGYVVGEGSTIEGKAYVRAE